MNKDFADRWVADLRDPNNKQCASVLHDGVGYCCLGRAVVVAGKSLIPYRSFEAGELVTREDEFIIEGSQNEDGTGGSYYDLDESTRKEIGLFGSEGSVREGMIEIGDRSFVSLADANDKGATFAQIADWVEKNWERL